MAGSRYPSISANERRRLRRNAWANQGGLCFYCGFQMDHAPVGDFGATLDHKTPVSKGGTWDATNIVMACRLCNEVKGNMTETEFKSLLDRIRFNATPQRYPTPSPA